MDDIARDPHADAPLTHADAARCRLKGPIAEFAPMETETAETQVAERFVTEPDKGDAPARLPRVLPLVPIEPTDDDDDLLGAPAVGGETVEGTNGLLEPGGGPLSGDGYGDEPVGGGDLAPNAAAAAITEPDTLVRVVLALLLTNREGLSALRLAQTCETTQDAVRAALDSVRGNLAAAGFPLELTQSGETFKLWTTPEAFPYFQKLRGIKRNERLSPAGLETLAVIAYRQPVFRAEIEAIRGVKAGPMLRSLLDCKLIKVVGRADVPGRPLQYGTTQQFLERFGLSSLADLPSVKEWKGLSG